MGKLKSPGPIEWVNLSNTITDSNNNKNNLKNIVLPTYTLNNVKKLDDHTGREILSIGTVPLYLKLVCNLRKTFNYDNITALCKK